MCRKLGLIMILLMLCAASLTACGSASSAPAEKVADGAAGGENKIKAAFVLGASISDGAFGTISYQGIQNVKEEAFIEQADFVEGVVAATDAAKAIRDYIADGYDVVWAQSGAHGASVMEIAPLFLDSVFVTLVAPPADQTFENVWFGLNECEGGYYIAGALAAQMTQTGTIGFVGGRENPLYVACSKAYGEGAKSVDPNVKVLTVFTGDFNDPIKAKEAAASQIQSGADLITHLQDLGMTGVFAAAEESTAAGKKVWVIGKGSDQYEQAPTVILSSVIMDYGVQMKDVLSEVAAGKRGGSMPMSVANGSIYLADFHGNVPAEVEAKIEELTEKVKAGEVTYTTQYNVE